MARLISRLPSMSEFTSVLRKCVTQACLFLVLGRAASADVVIENRYVRLELSDDAQVRHLVYKPTGEECLAPGADAPAFAAVDYRAFVPAKVTPARTIRRDGDKLIVTFEPLVTVATFRLKITDDYIGFQLEQIGGPGSYGDQKAWYSEYNEETQPFEELRMLQLPLRERGKFGAWLNVDWNDTLAVNLLATDPYMDIQATAAPNMRTLWGSMWPEVKTTPVGMALIVAPPDQLLTQIGKLEADYGLPHGAASRMSADVRQSCWEIQDPLTPGNVDRIIDYAHRAGIRQIQVYHHAFAKSGGHFAWRDEYPHGAEDVRAAVKRMTDAGLTVGVHIHFNKAGVDDPYVAPVPDRRLNLRRHFTLAEGIGTTGGTIRVLENPQNCTLDEGRRILRFGDEFIQYRSYTTEPPYEFFGCERGVLGTKAAAHEAGIIGGLLDVDNWPIWVRFNQATDIQDEVAKRLGEIYHEVGFRFVYFDGSEDVHAPYWFNVSNAQWRVYRELKPEPLFSEASHFSHFDWHMMSRSHAEDTPRPDGIKRLVQERRLREAAEWARNFTRCDFGWVRLYPPGAKTALGMQPDILEYVDSRGAGWDCPITITGFLEDFAANPRTSDNLEVLRRWELARSSGWLTEAKRRELQQAAPEHTLLVDEKGNLELAAGEMIPVGGPGSTVRAFLFQRHGAVWVSFWDTRGQSRLQVPLAGAQARLFRTLGQPQSVEQNAGNLLLTADDRQYLEISGASAEQVKTAFARAMPRQ